MYERIQNKNLTTNKIKFNTGHYIFQIINCNIKIYNLIKHIQKNSKDIYSKNKLIKLKTKKKKIINHNYKYILKLNKKKTINNIINIK